MLGSEFHALHPNMPDFALFYKGSRGVLGAEAFPSQLTLGEGRVLQNTFETPC